MRRITKAWLQAAYEDYLMAQKAMEIELYRQVCFHSQQCAEKGMKAVGFLPHGEPTREDAQRTLEIARRVFAQVERVLQ